MGKRRRQKQGRTSRSFIVEVIGLPESGKSTLINSLLPFFQGVKIKATKCSQDDESEIDLIRGLRKQLGILSSRGSCDAKMGPLFHEFASVIFRAIFKVYALKVQLSLDDIVLFEQGPYFTTIVERIWAGVPREILAQDLKGVQEPDLVMFLPVTPQEIRMQPITHSRMLLDYSASQKIYNEMDRISRRKKNWVRIERRETPAETARLAFGEIVCKWREHRDHCSTRPKKFTL